MITLFKNKASSQVGREDQGRHVRAHDGGVSRSAGVGGKLISKQGIFGS